MNVSNLTAKQRILTFIITTVSFSIQAENKISDPYENFNRSMYGFNESVDNYVAAPIANTYKTITPQFMQTGVFNFFNNLKNVNVVLNDVLQGKFSQGFQDTGRFAVNTTLGAGGLFDVANHFGWQQNDEDFDQTLAVWGVPQGSYLVLPLVGPMTMRGAPASAFDTAANPATYVGLFSGYISAPVQFMALTNARANAEGALQFINEAALDKYVFTRESFLQWRKNLERDGKVELDEELLDEKNTQNGLKLRLNDYRQFEQASHSFSHAAQLFQTTTSHFENTNRKIDLLKK